MKKILLSLLSIGMVGAVAFGATTAFFTDTETSTDNILAAGAIDLGIDNDSFFNGGLNTGTSWELTFDLDDEQGPAQGAYLFYDFHDLKPGDFGEDTISIQVKDNDAWVCSDTTITSNQDNSCTEPEDDDDFACGTGDPTSNGDLAQEIEIMWWADDGDNVLEVGETVLDIGSLGAVPLDTPVTVTLADSLGSIFDALDLSADPLTEGALIGGDTYHVAKAWCFGDLTPAPLAPAGYAGPDVATNAPDAGEVTSEDGGFNCDGAEVIDNASQTDSVTLDVSFYAEQARNNESFTCLPE